MSKMNSIVEGFDDMEPMDRLAALADVVATNVAMISPRRIQHAPEPEAPEATEVPEAPLIAAGD